LGRYGKKRDHLSKKINITQWGGGGGLLLSRNRAVGASERGRDVCEDKCVETIELWKKKGERGGASTMKGGTKKSNKRREEGNVLGSRKGQRGFADRKD